MDTLVPYTTLFRDAAVQRHRDLQYQAEVRLVLAALDLAQVRTFDAGAQGQRFLRDAARSTGGADHGAKRLGRHRVEGGGAAGTAALDLALLHGGSVGWRLEDNHVTFNSWRQTHADTAFNPEAHCAR